MTLFANWEAANVLSWLPVEIGFHVGIFLLVCYSCLTTRRESAATILWIFVAWSFPVVGPLLYLMFGINRVPRKALRKQKASRRLQAERQTRAEIAISGAMLQCAREFLASGKDAESCIYLNRTLDRLTPETPLLAGNSATPFVDGDQAYPAMLAAIAGARRHIHLQTFIIGNDDTGRKFMELLAAKAAEGVKVRFLYDVFGSTAAFVGGLFERYSRAPNMRIHGWTQANLLKRQLQINLRNHRKILVVDGETAFTGGINLRNDNLSRPAAPAIRDYHFMFRGPVVHEFQYSFLDDWHFMTGEKPRELLQPEYFPALAPAGPALARVVSSGPTPEEMEAAAKVFFECINWARRELLVVTPYFVPSQDILRSFKSAAARGVDVRVLLPEKNNHIYTGLASKALYEELLDAGVRIFERKPPFMHAKAMLADGRAALVGSANLDMRSLRLNYESNALVFDGEFTGRLEEIIRTDFASSREISAREWRRRKLWRKISENVCYLMMPVL